MPRVLSLDGVVKIDNFELENSWFLIKWVGGMNLRPEQVFTPRSTSINDQMYVVRPDLEKRIKSSLLGDKYTIIYGESGNGKSWLYKKVFADSNIYYEVLNLGSANSCGNINGVIEDKLGQRGVSFVDKKETIIKSGIRPMNIGVEVDSKSHSTSVRRASLLELFEQMRGAAGARSAVLVFDNFEQIVDSQDNLREMRGYLLQVDDESYSRFKVKIFIVGVPGNIKNLISASSSATTISNRVVVIPEVGSLSESQAIELMDRGFFEKIGLKSDVEKATIFSKIAWATDRIAQHVHELCLIISQKSLERFPT